MDVLMAYGRNLRSKFDITTADSGENAVRILRSDNSFAAIVTDFNMPAMNGVELLQHAREITPDTTRILITGYADLNTSINAVNQGNVYRFLTKPIPTADLIRNIEEAVEYNRLLNAEKELLDKTLKGTIRALADILAFTNPTIFKQKRDELKLARKTAEYLGIKNLWEIEIALMLAPIGAVAVPDTVMEKKLSGKILSESEAQIYNSIPTVGSSIISKIPRLEKVSQIVMYQFHDFPSETDNKIQDQEFDIRTLANLIRSVNEITALLRKNTPPIDALHLLQESKSFSPDVLRALEKAVIDLKNEVFVASASDKLKKSYAQGDSAPAPAGVPFQCNISELQSGWILLEPIKDFTGKVILNKGYEITDIIKQKLINLTRVTMISEPIKVYIVK